MRIPAGIGHIAVCAAALTLAAGVLTAGEKTLMHCFAYAPIESATEADWQAFYKATDELPGKIPGLRRVWYGKLRQPLPIYNPDAETRKKMGQATSGSGQINRVVRMHGVCMEMDDQKALDAYAKHPAHDAWVAVYSKVRQPGTTTFDILGQ